MNTTRASKLAGSWYSASAKQLQNEFHKILNDDIDTLEKSPFVLAPHAGHRFCLPQILNSLKHLDVDSKTKTVIVIGPSHKVAFKNKIYFSPFKQLHTPVGNLTVDDNAIERLTKTTPKYLDIASESMDQNEHCLEIIYPALKYLLALKGDDNIKIIPAIISRFDSEKVLKDVIKQIFTVVDPANTKVVVSSDFTHWGYPYDYDFKIDTITSFKKYITRDKVDIELDGNIDINLLNLASMLVLSPHQKIDKVVYEKMETPQLAHVSSIKNNWSILHNFKTYLMGTEDTICGMYPIIFVLSILDDELLRNMFNLSKEASFIFVDYNYSGRVTQPDDYRVSYVSGFITN